MCACVCVEWGRGGGGGALGRMVSFYNLSSVYIFSNSQGTLISIFINTLHRHPDLWDFPDRFLPERFSNDNARLPFSYIPFSAGPRWVQGSLG